MHKDMPNSPLALMSEADFKVSFYSNHCQPFKYGTDFNLYTVLI